jgi:hypothetical protein
MEKPMAPDERDRSFDKALSRHLRSAASPSVSANLPSGPAAPGASCLDSETLAAYHERSLLPEEMNSCKEHIVGCAHCQAILAQLEATDSILLPVEEKEVQIMDVATPVAATAIERTAAQTTFPDKASSPRPIRAPRWWWLAPAGALAAGLLVWVARHENQPHLLEHNEIKMARVQEPPTPAPPAARQAPASSSSDQLADFSKTPAAIGGTASDKISRELGNLKQQGKLDSQAMVASPKPSAHRESGARPDKDTALDSFAAASRVENQPNLDAQTAVKGAAEEKAEAQTQAANAPVQNQANAAQVPSPSPLGQAESTKKPKSESAASLYRAAAPSAPAPPRVAAFSDSAAMQIAALTNSRLIAAPAPDSKIMWRVGQAGVIEFSSDGGASWSRQTSGVSVDLTAGSAPSAKVCWIVGRAGTILLTTDGGEQWSVIHPPVEENLEGVQARDSRHAVVFASKGFEAFETKNGGKTWKRWVSKE